MGRAWQCSTIQLDFNLPHRFGLSYTGSDGKSHQPIMIHRAVLGSIERFMGILVEHFAGAFPTWLAPVQVRILTLGDTQVPYATTLLTQLRKYGFRAELDSRSEKMNLKIREAQTSKIPYMLIIGDREVEADTISIRKRKEGPIGSMTLSQFIDMLQEEALEKPLASMTPEST